MPISVFEQFRGQAWPYKYEVGLECSTIAGGTPTNQKVAEGFIKSKLAAPDDIIREEVAKLMAERGVTAEEAAKLVGDSRHLNGFRSDEVGLYIEGRQVKAALKEAASVAVAAGKLSARGWGTTNKGLMSFLAEHVVVDDDRIYLHIDGVPVQREQVRIVQRFVHTFRGTGIQYEEVLDNVELLFTVLSDWSFSKEQWAMIWLTGEEQGVGAARSQGMGRYKTTKFDQVEVGAKGATVEGKSRVPAKAKTTRTRKAALAE